MTVTIVDGCLLGGLGALAFVAPAHADETAALPDDAIIVTGTKTSGEFGGKSGIPLEDVPQSVQLFTSDDLAERGITSIGDILRAVPSGNFGNSRVSRYQSFSLKIRGFLADQMRNGIRQRYYEDVDASALSNIERIEVLKGPSAVLYGQSAVGGIISIITKAPQNDFGLAASASVGRFDQMVAKSYEENKALSGASFLEVDDVIDPAETRRLIVRCLRSLPPRQPRAGKKRPAVDVW